MGDFITYAIGLPYIMGVWEGHRKRMVNSHAREFAVQSVCVENVHVCTVGHVQRNISAIACGVARP